ncbi:MAG: hypothetical protein AAF959_29095 [Cyanobacteria bacterium P01_D01_bin.56]
MVRLRWHPVLVAPNTLAVHLRKRLFHTGSLQPSPAALSGHISVGDGAVWRHLLRTLALGMGICDFGSSVQPTPD